MEVGNQACEKTSLSHRVRKPKQQIENRDYSYVGPQFSFTYNCSYESNQSRLKSEPDAKQLNWMIKGIATCKGGVDEEEE